mmetsp:Transcript_17625/g.57013  ORF Transcript_17625/g.57013 Transcript_17625/m.57013 type:complete len:160 (-) Transcript_17625:246-725(-)
MASNTMCTSGLAAAARVTSPRTSTARVARAPAGATVGSPSARFNGRIGVSVAQRRVAVKAERGSSSGGSFVGGFLLGGAVFGALGFLFAPEISKRILGEDKRLAIPKFLDDDDGSRLEVTRQSLNDKIAQLNEAIDDVSKQLGDSEEVGGAEGTAEGTA